MINQELEQKLGGDKGTSNSNSKKQSASPVVDDGSSDKQTVTQVDDEISSPSGASDQDCA